MIETLKKIGRLKKAWYINKLKNCPLFFLYRIRSFVRYYAIKLGLYGGKIERINLGSGPVLLRDYFNIDLYWKTDLSIDLEKKLLPFKSNSIQTIVCISTINYFTRKRGEEIIKDVFRVLKSGGIARFATQDLELIALRYVNKDTDFFFQKLPNGNDRFIGETIGDKFNSWFYGYAVKKNKSCKYFYDYETLALLFKKVGFKKVEKKEYLESAIQNVEKIDNRPDQMFFLEALK